jgi:hypothetical protein
MVDSSRDNRNNADVAVQRRPAKARISATVFLKDSLSDMLVHATLACTLYLVYYRYVYTLHSQNLHVWVNRCR